jgi:hypothetical protein
MCKKRRYRRREYLSHCTSVFSKVGLCYKALLDSYIAEAEHAEGGGYWLFFDTPQDCLEDFLLYVDTETLRV